jgi:predicted PurR-regulated permease PerM
VNTRSLTRPAAISYGVFAGLLVLVAALHLATPLLAALFSYLALTKLAFWGKKWIGLSLFAVLLVAAFLSGVFFLKTAFIVLPEIVSTAIPVVVGWAEQYGVELPFTDVESLRTVALEGVRDTLGRIGKYVKLATKESVLLVVGMVVALGIFMNPEFEPKRRRGRGRLTLYSYYTARIQERFASFYRSFEAVMGAQLIISTVNTAATAVFIYLANLPYAPVVVMLTFVCGLLPIVGNLISNTIIIGLAFTISPQRAATALIVLVAIHRLLYFFNAQIIGGRIDHPMWLTLLALIIGERLMGISGIILAPIILSFIKVEMKKIEMSEDAIPVPRREPKPRREVANV